MSINMNDNMNDNMNHDQHSSLLRLQQQGLLKQSDSHDDLLNETESTAHSPWFINVLFGFSGFFASLFFIGFLTLILDSTGLLDSTLGLVVIGSILSGIGWFLFYNARLRHSPFWNSLAFAITLAGQGYIAFGLLAHEIERPLNVIILMLLQLFMTIIVPNFMYRLFSATLALTCLLYLLIDYQLSEVSLGLLALIAVVTHLQRYSLASLVPHHWRMHALEIISAIAYASAYVLLLVSVYFIAAEYGNDFNNYGDPVSYNYYLAQGLLTLASLYAAALILRRYRVKLLCAAGVIIVGSTLVMGVLSIYVSGLLATSLIIIIAMANSQRILLGAGIVALVCYVFWYYYQLDTSLLLKSASMLIIGVSLLLLRWILIKRYFKNENSPTLSADKERLL